jgi:hypothetical protein
MKQIYLLIGTMLALMLCISPVAAFTGDEYIDVVDESGDIPSYTYKNWAYLNEKYIHIFTKGTALKYSLVTFKPVNIPDAPKMYVYTNSKCDIYLPKSVDEWEIKFYSRWRHEPNICIGDLKNSVVVDLKENFRHHVDEGLILELSKGQYIYPQGMDYFRYDIPEVD